MIQSVIISECIIEMYYWLIIIFVEIVQIKVMSFFSSFGGFPFGGGFSSHDDEDSEPQEVDNKRYYEILEVSKTATTQQITKQYRELAKKYHPDRKTGDAAKFKEISEAYETLSDPEKRRIYDKYGTKGPQADNSDIMNMFFGGGARSNGRREMQKVKATKKALEVTLEQAYNGAVIKVTNERTRCCQVCKGKGGQNVKTCGTCKGKGRVVQMYQMGPGMYQQVQKACDTCKGEGQIISQGGKCKSCLGKKIVNKQKILEVPVEKGVFHGHAITLSGQGNQIPDALAGDLIFVIQEKPHQLFTRKGADLYMKKSISLAEALVGFEFKLKHLDGSIYNIYTGKGEVLGDKEKKVVRGLGMPFFKDSMSYGNLIVEFKIEMPKRGQFSNQQLEELAKILPGKVNERPKDNNYEMLEDFEKEHVNTSEEGGHKNIEEEEEQEQSGGCRAQ